MLLHFFGYLSKAGGGGGVHCKYADSDSIAEIVQFSEYEENVLRICSIYDRTVV